MIRILCYFFDHTVILANLAFLFIWFLVYLASSVNLAVLIYLGFLTNLTSQAKLDFLTNLDFSSPLKDSTFSRLQKYGSPAKCHTVPLSRFVQPNDI